MKIYRNYSPVKTDKVEVQIMFNNLVLLPTNNSSFLCLYFYLGLLVCLSTSGNDFIGPLSSLVTKQNVLRLANLNVITD
jgi:hypothetical protein